MNEDNVLGDWSDHTETTWEQAHHFSEQIGRERETIDRDGYECCIKAATADKTGERIAWIETREKETRPVLWDVTHYLKVSRDQKILIQWELPTYNPFFGCDVGFLKWFDDQIGMIYREKHKTIAAVYDSSARDTGRLFAISEKWKCIEDVLYFESKEYGLIENCTFPHFEPGVPFSVKVSPENHRFIPKAEFPMDEFASKLARNLFGNQPPQPLADTLIGAAAYRFWDSWPSPVFKYDFERRWNSPFWLPYYWYGATDEKFQSELLNHMEDLSSKSFITPLKDDYAINLAAEHVCRSAELWLKACRSMCLPEGHWCQFWVEWSQTEFQKSLNLFPTGLREVYEQLRQTELKKGTGFFQRLFGRK